MFQYTSMLLFKGHSNNINILHTIKSSDAIGRAQLMKQEIKKETSSTLSSVQGRGCTRLLIEGSHF